MLQNIKYPESGEYRTGEEHEPICFFLNALPVSKQFDILLGYFSSSAFNVLSLGFANFIYNGGKVRMIINNVLSAKDKELLIIGSQSLESDYNFSIQNFRQIVEALDEYGTHFFNCLAWLIASNKLEIKSIVITSNERGMSHFKSGILSDGKDKVKFGGSCNFTASGLLANGENLDVRQSWEGKRDVAAIKGQEEYFEKIFSDKADFTKHISHHEIEEAIVNSFGDKNLQELLINERELIKKKKNKVTHPHVKKIFKSLEEHTERIISEPRFPFPKPRKYQSEAYKMWVANNYKGIFAMATGTGKTITSLNCVLEIWKKTGNYKVIILVPTLTLVEQWEREALSFNFNEVIKVSSKEKWTNLLSDKLTYAKKIPKTNFIVITTYPSFSKNKFQSFFKRFPKDTILIADEGHNMASKSMLQTYSKIDLDKRICLSATPNRVYDQEGTSQLESFFDDKPPYIVSFSMKRAIDEDILCKYYYYPHLVKLTKDEFSDYKEISAKLVRHLNFKNNDSKLSPIAEILLLERKRIIQKAKNKLTQTINILQKQFDENGDLKFTFLYSPEGFERTDDEDVNEGEEIRIIGKYTREIAKIDKSITIDQFIGGMKDKSSVLRNFENGKIHILASMKCLDEGVDVPRAEYAIFCSSTGNPRQFIQRRGRILRKDKKNEKHIATIHDLVVIPDYDDYSNADTLNMERNLIRKELERVIHFAALSINPYHTDEVFEKVCEYYRLNIHSIKNQLVIT
jgi:superfamily II DNA or RNA helicase